MDEELNMSVRKFLKQVGVTSQQAIEAAVRDARENGTLPSGSMPAKVVLTIDGLNLTHEIDGKIVTGDPS